MRVGPSSASVTPGEALALMLLSEHNLRYLLDLTAEARYAIESGGFASFRSSTLDRLEDVGAHAS